MVARKQSQYTRPLAGNHNPKQDEWVRNDSMAQELIPIGIMAIFGKKRLHLSDGLDTIDISRGSC